MTEKENLEGKVADFNIETNRLKSLYSNDPAITKRVEKKPTGWGDVAIVLILCATVVAVTWIIAQAVS